MNVKVVFYTIFLKSFAQYCAFIVGGVIVQYYCCACEKICLNVIRKIYHVVLQTAFPCKNFKIKTSYAMLYMIYQYGREPVQIQRITTSFKATLKKILLPGARWRRYHSHGRGDHRILRDSSRGYILGIMWGRSFIHLGN